MTDNTPDVASATAAQPPALKSTDTSSVKRVTQAVDVAKAEEAKAEEAKVAEDASTQAAADDTSSNEDEPNQDAPPADVSKKKDRLPRWVQERMERVRLKTEAETRERVLREIQQQNQPQAPVEEVRAEPEKTLEDFNYDLAAFTDYKVQQKLAEEQRSREKREQERKQAEATEKEKARVDVFEERVGAGAWQDIVESPINTDPALKPLVELFWGDEHDLDIAHHFAQHPDEAHRISGLPRLQQIRELAKLAEQFDEPVKAEKPPLPKKTTNAPPPPKTISGAGKPAATDAYAPGMTPEQRIAAWKKGGARN